MIVGQGTQLTAEELQICDTSWREIGSGVEPGVLERTEAHLYRAVPRPADQRSPNLGALSGSATGNANERSEETIRPQKDAKEPGLIVLLMGCVPKSHTCGTLARNFLS